MVRRVVNVRRKQRRAVAPEEDVHFREVRIRGHEIRKRAPGLAKAAGDSVDEDDGVDPPPLADAGGVVAERDDVLHVVTSVFVNGRVSCRPCRQGFHGRAGACHLSSRGVRSVCGKYLVHPSVWPRFALRSSKIQHGSCLDRGRGPLARRARWKEIDFLKIDNINNML